jgi:hypothetical protein
MATRKKPAPKGRIEQLHMRLQAMESKAVAWLRRHARHRTLFVWIAPLAVLVLMWLTDPANGAQTEIWLIKVVSAVVAGVFGHWADKAIFDYPEADRQSLFAKAGEDATGAGLALVARAIFFLALMLLFMGQVRAQDVRTFIPPRCDQNLEVLRGEQLRWWADHPRPQLLPALVEHESCVTLKSSRCCSGQAQLKSAREEGASILQITRAFRADGSVRFDALQELKERHPALAEWSWGNVYQRTDLANRAVVLKMRDNFQLFVRLGASADQALWFADAGYNGGNAGVQWEQRVCGRLPGCDPMRWPGNVELHCMKSKVALYGGRSACDINRHHVRDVLVTRAPKYARRLQADESLP